MATTSEQIAQAQGYALTKKVTAREYAEGCLLGYLFGSHPDNVNPHTNLYRLALELAAEYDDDKRREKQNMTTARLTGYMAAGVEFAGWDFEGVPTTKGGVGEGNPALYRVTAKPDHAKIETLDGEPLLVMRWEEIYRRLVELAGNISPEEQLKIAEAQANREKYVAAAEGRTPAPSTTTAKPEQLTFC